MGINTDDIRIFDLHTHALPGIDDGASTVEESMELLNSSFAQGVRLTALTPHCVLHEEQDLQNFIDRRDCALARLAEEGKRSGIPHSMLVGAEVYADHDISRWEGIRRLCYAPVSNISEDNGLVSTPKDKLLLIELPVGKHVDYLERCVYNLNAKGIRVLIAHIERCWNAEWAIRKTNHLDAYYQVNADTVMHLGGRRLFSRLLQSTGRMIISSDMHNTERRPCIMGACREILERKFGRIVAEAVLSHNARAALGLSNDLI